MKKKSQKEVQIVGFAFEFLSKYVFLAAFATATFGLGTIFPRPVRLVALERLSRMNLALVAACVFCGLSIGIVVTLAMFLILGEWMRLVYIFAVTIYMVRFIQITRLLSLISVPPVLEKVITAVLAVSLGSIWAIMPNWVTYDLVAFICGYVFLSSIAQKRINPLLAIFIAVVAYDAWGVIGSSVIGGGAIVQVVGQAKDHFLPVGLILTPWGGMLGLGDVVIPGLLVVLAERYGLVREATIGWAVGLMVLFFMLVVARTPLPATIVLVPTTLFAFLFAASQKKVQLQWS